MKKYIIGLGVLGALLLSGCAGQPQFQPNNKIIGFIKGKPYYAPAYSAHKTLSKSDAKNLKLLGINCPTGSVLWANPSLVALIDKGTQAEKDYEVKRGFASGNMGCINPLSKQEYQYRLNQQNQNAANARVSSQSYSNNYSVPSYTRSSSNSYSDSISSLSRPYSSAGPSSDWGNYSRKKNTYSVRRLDDNHYSVSSR